MTPSPTTVQPSSQISGIQSADDPRILRKANSSACRKSAHFPFASLNTYLADLALVDDSQEFFSAMGRIQRERISA